MKNKNLRNHLLVGGIALVVMISALGGYHYYKHAPSKKPETTKLSPLERMEREVILQIKDYYYPLPIQVREVHIYYSYENNYHAIVTFKAQNHATKQWEPFVRVKRLDFHPSEDGYIGGRCKIRFTELPIQWQ